MAGQILVKLPILNFVYIHEMGLELFHVYRQTYGQAEWFV
jgi:hypothetical protein